VQAVRSGRALYAGVSNYPASLAAQAADYLREEKVPLLIHQPSYSMLNRWIEDGLTSVLEEKGVGCIPFSPLAQGLLTNRYLAGIPTDSRAARPTGFLQSSAVTEEKISLIRKLNDLAVERGQTLAQMAVAWILRLPVVTSVLVGASRVAQLEDTVASLQKLEFSADELSRIETILREP
jgi:L-glyceraldehyde 3-phosphate reductase